MPAKRRKLLQYKNLHIPHIFGMAFAKELMPKVTTSS